MVNPEGKGGSGKCGVTYFTGLSRVMLVTKNKTKQTLSFNNGPEQSTRSIHSEGNRQRGYRTGPLSLSHFQNWDQHI